MILTDLPFIDTDSDIMPLIFRIRNFEFFGTSSSSVFIKTSPFISSLSSRFVMSKSALPWFDCHKLGNSQKFCSKLRLLGNTQGYEVLRYPRVNWSLHSTVVSYTQTLLQMEHLAQEQDDPSFQRHSILLLPFSQKILPYL